MLIFRQGCFAKSREGAMAENQRPQTFLELERTRFPFKQRL